MGCKPLAWWRYQFWHGERSPRLEGHMRPSASRPVLRRRSTIRLTFSPRPVHHRRNQRPLWRRVTAPPWTLTPRPTSLIWRPQIEALRPIAFFFPPLLCSSASLLRPFWSRFWVCLACFCMCVLVHRVDESLPLVASLCRLSRSGRAWEPEALGFYFCLVLLLFLRGVPARLRLFAWIMNEIHFESLE